jgi:hypothetical protein
MPTWFQITILVLPIILPPLTALSALAYQRLLQHLPAQKREIVEQIVRTVVPAIEQTATDAMDSPTKKAAAMNLAGKMLDNLNVDISPDMLSGMIEATVFALNQGKGASKVIVQPSPLAESKTN